MTHPVERVLDLEPVQRDVAVDWYVFGIRYKNQPLFRYSESASDDYRVLEHVRTRWPFEQRSRFRQYLEWLWSSRWDALLPGWTCGPLTYRPGDYATAAVAVVKGEEL